MKMPLVEPAVPAKKSKKKGKKAAKKKANGAPGRARGGRAGSNSPSIPFSTASESHKRLLTNMRAKRAATVKEPRSPRSAGLVTLRSRSVLQASTSFWSARRRGRSSRLT